MPSTSEHWLSAAIGRRCTKDATHALYNTFNDRIGVFCYEHATKALANRLQSGG